MGKSALILNSVLHQMCALGISLRVGLRNEVPPPGSLADEDQTYPPELYGQEIIDRRPSASEAGLVVGQVFEFDSGWRDVCLVAYDVESVVEMPQYIDTCLQTCLKTVQSMVKSRGGQPHGSVG